MALKRRPPQDFEAGRYERCPGPIRLYLDDLDDLVAFMAEHAEDVELAAGDAVADSAEDLRSATRKELKALDIQTRGPRVWVALSSTHSHALTWDENDAESKALVDDVYRLLRQRRSVPTLVFGTAPLYFTLAVIGLTVLTFKTEQEFATRLNYVLFVLFALTISAMRYYFALQRGWCRVILSRRSSRRLVTATTAQQGAVALVTGLIVAAVSVYLTKKYGS